MNDIQVRIMRAGASGKDAWTPVTSVVPDGFRLVMQISNWVGGEGEKPTTGLYIGPSGYVDEISEAVDVRGVGQKGWSPAFAVISDGERRVLQVFDWTGGEGEKPATGQYVSLNGLTDDIAAGIDIRGPVGPQGEIGPQGIQGPMGATGSVTEPNQVTNINLADMPANTIKGRIGTAGDPQDLTAEQVYNLIEPNFNIRPLLKIELQLTPVTTIVQALPSWVNHLLVDGVLAPTTAAASAGASLCCQFSFDGGVTYLSSIYAGVATAFSGATAVGIISPDNMMALSGSTTQTNLPSNFQAKITLPDFINRQRITMIGQTFILSDNQGKNVTRCGWTASTISTVRATHIRFLMSNGGFIGVGTGILLRGW